VVHCFVPSGTAPAGPARIALAAKGAAAWPADAARDAARRAEALEAIEEAGRTKGYCLVIGLDDGRLAREIALNSEMMVIAADPDRSKAAAVRGRMAQAGLLGTRVSVHDVDALTLPYQQGFANLVVSETPLADLPVPRAELARVLRPSGGVICLHSPEMQGPSERTRVYPEGGEAYPEFAFFAQGERIIAQRGEVDGAGSWTHQYGDAGNSCDSGDALLAADLEMQWFGEPGPLHMMDRHCRPPSPLSVGGRLYVPGYHHLWSVDAHNGAILWEKEMPDLDSRVNLPQDSGYMVADADSLCVAVGSEALRFHGDTGDVVTTYRLPQFDGREGYDWGYLAQDDGLVFGSTVRKGSFYTDAMKPWYDGGPGPNHDKVCSDRLFAADRETGEVLWTFEGLFMHSAIAIGDGTVYAAEIRNPAALEVAKTTGRIPSEGLWEDLHLVALDARTGAKRWERPTAFSPGLVVFYLSYSDGALVVTSSPFTDYGLYAFNASDGSPRWETRSIYRPDRNTDNHGGHMQHPVLMGGMVYQDPTNFDLATGAKGDLLITRDGHGCGVLTGAAGLLFGRGDYPRLYDLANAGKSAPLTRVSRPGCWINMIPAGGLVLVPEASSGCTCGYSMQATFALAAGGT